MRQTIAENKGKIAKYLTKTFAFFVIALLCTVTSTVDASGSRQYQIIFQYGGITIERFCLSMLLSVLLYLAAWWTCRGMRDELLWLFSLTPALCVVFFAFPIVTTWDTALYQVMARIIEGGYAWSEWDTVRGIVFPAILAGFKFVFGPGRIGMLTGLFLSYQVFLVFALKLIYEMGGRIREKSKAGLAFALVVCFNPLLLGGFHTLLCEFVGALIAIMSIYFAYRWSKTTVGEWKKQAGYFIYFFIMSIISYHLKQTYVAAVLCPLMGAALIVLLRAHSWREWMCRIGTVLLCAAGLFVSIQGWSAFILSHQANPDRMISSGNVGKGIMVSLAQFQQKELVKELSEEEWQNDAFLSEQDIARLQELGSDLSDRNDVICDVVDWEGRSVGRTVLFKKDTNPTLKEALDFLAKEIIAHPRAVMSSWIKDYLGFADVLQVRASAENISAHRPSSEVEYGMGDENKAIFYRGYLARGIGENVIYIDPLYKEYEEIDLYEIMYGYFNPFVTSYAASMIAQITISLFTSRSYQWVVLSFPFLFICSGVLLLKKKKGENIKIPEIVFLTACYSFLQTVVHVLMIAPIDRYIFASYAVAIVAILAAAVAKLQSGSINKTQK